MLGAVMFGHRSFQPVIDAIIDLAEACAKEPLDLPRDAARARRSGRARPRDWPKPNCARPTRRPSRQRGATRSRPSRSACRRALSEDESHRPDAGVRASRRGVQGSREGRRPTAHPRRRATHRRPRHAHRPADRRRGGAAAAGARQRAVHPRRDAGAGRHHARHRPGRTDRRRARRRVPRALHAALQLPAVLGRRGRPLRLYRPARGRPRQARLAGDPSADAGQGRLPLHHPRRLGDHRVRTARRRWRPCAARRCR